MKLSDGRETILEIILFLAQNADENGFISVKISDICAKTNASKPTAIETIKLLGNLGHGQSGGFSGRKAVLMHDPLHVFHHDDGVIDQQADGQNMYYAKRRGYDLKQTVILLDEPTSNLDPQGREIGRASCRERV